MSLFSFKTISIMRDKNIFIPKEEYSLRLHNIYLEGGVFKGISVDVYNQLCEIRDNAKQGFVSDNIEISFYDLKVANMCYGIFNQYEAVNSSLPWKSINMQRKAFEGYGEYANVLCSAYVSSLRGDHPNYFPHIRLDSTFRNLLFLFVNDFMRHSEEKFIRFEYYELSHYDFGSIYNC